MHAFIIRPFGTKSDIDFERVERELISPALEKLGIAGRTTKEILQAGNIREDMFQLLITADLIVADLSIDNANVFYELGIRHALREKRTFLIRCGAGKVPFDLLTDRYLEYDQNEPKNRLEDLVAGLRRTLDSEAADSPVLKLLNLPDTDIARLLTVPADFREEVRRAEKEGRLGDLSLLSEEARLLRWAVEGLRTVGVAQFNQASYEPARITWEAVREYDSNDLEANTRLATLYQKLNDVTRSDEAVERVLKRADVRGPERAELQSLRASNAKTRWIAEWRSLAPEERPAAALRSPWLRKAYDEYTAGFTEDRNHYYSGLNALALLTVMLELGRALPEVWGELYDGDDEARNALADLTREREKLATAVDFSLQGTRRRFGFERKEDRWLDISDADYACLTATRPARVAALYRDALADAARFHLTAARRQLEIYDALGVVAANTKAALQVIDAKLAKLQDTTPSKLGRVLLFTGHRVDTAERTQPRFPAAAEGVARAMIKEAVEAELRGAEGEVIGYAGGASGGDILFHEVCAELGIPTQLFLAGPRDAYVTHSVQDAGPQWVERFDKLSAKLPTRVLGDSQGVLELPRWLRPLTDYSVWQRSNLWLLHNALVHGASKVTLLALWNGEGGDGPGGTADMVEKAKQRGAKTVLLDAKRLLTAEVVS